MAVLRLQFAPPNDDCMPAEEAELDAFLDVALFISTKANFPFSMYVYASIIVYLYFLKNNRNLFYFSKTNSRGVMTLVLMPRNAYTALAL